MLKRLCWSICWSIGELIISLVGAAGRCKRKAQPRAPLRRCRGRDPSGRRRAPGVLRGRHLVCVLYSAPVCAWLRGGSRRRAVPREERPFGPLLLHPHISRRDAICVQVSVEKSFRIFNIHYSIFWHVVLCRDLSTPISWWQRAICDRLILPHFMTTIWEQRAKLGGGVLLTEFGLCMPDAYNNSVNTVECQSTLAEVLYVTFFSTLLQNPYFKYLIYSYLHRTS